MHLYEKKCHIHCLKQHGMPSEHHLNKIIHDNINLLVLLLQGQTSQLQNCKDSCCFHSIHFIIV